MRLREILQNEFPGQWNSIRGDNYPVPEWTSYVSSVISALQIFAMLLVLMGDSLWTYIPGFQRPPEFYHKMKENPALTFIVVFLVIPTYVQSFANTGAFEVYVDEKLVRHQCYHMASFLSACLITYYRFDAFHPKRFFLN